MNLNKKKLATTLLCGALMTSAIGGAYSYFTNSTDTKENTFTIANGGNASDKGLIIEEEWYKIKDTDEVKHIQPGATLVKDPKFKSNANYSTYVYAEVTVPAVKSSAGDTIKIDGTVPEAKTPYMTLQDIGNKWILLGSDKDSVDGEIMYVYGYTDEVPANGETETIFNSFKMADFSKFPESETNQQIDIKAKTVQTQGQGAHSLDNYKTLFGANDNLK